MKYLMLVCESMTDDPLEELGGRTPLETAKLPNLTKLAQKGVIGNANFIAREIGPLRDAAVMTMLGVDPLKKYSGPAPLEAVFYKAPHRDTDLVFFCDFVTMTENQMVDDRAGNITTKQVLPLLEVLNQHISKEGMRFIPGSGFRNFLVLTNLDQAETMDDLETFSPKSVLGQDYGKFLPKGQGDKQVRYWMEKSREILESHEINRVRIDLGENPANRIWLWGQGRKPKLPAFSEIAGLDGGIISDEVFVEGLGELLGMKRLNNLDDGFGVQDFILVYDGAPHDKVKEWDYRTKVRRLEEFDQRVLGPALTLFEKEECKICVTTDFSVSTPKKQTITASSPFMVVSRENPSDPKQFFNEKTAASSRLAVDKGYKLLEYFLKGTGAR